MPLLRLDCGFSDILQRCFISELCSVDMIMFSETHAQDLAHVHGAGCAKGLAALLK